MRPKCAGIVFQNMAGANKNGGNETSPARVAARIARKPNGIRSCVICPGGVGFETSSAKGYMASPINNFARKQMRHQTIRQTDGYTDEAQLPIYDSIKNLPRLRGVHKCAQRFQAQTVKTWRNLAQRVKGRKVKNRL